MDRTDVKLFVQSYLNAKGREVGQWRDNMPGKEWMISFLKKHEREIRSRKPELLTKQRAEGLTKETVEKFFDLYEKVLRENDLGTHLKVSTI